MSVHSTPAPTSTPTPRHAVSIHDLADAKSRGERFSMITSYDYLSAQLLDEAGIPVLLVGDSLGMVVLGYESTVPVTVDEMLHHVKAVSRGAPHALVVADLPFGSYQSGPAAAFDAATRMLKEGGANAVKLEGGGTSIESTRLLVQAGIPVMAHVGLTPQSVNQFGGFKVQGRGDEAGDKILADAIALEAAGAFAIVLEAMPVDLAARITAALTIPTIGIGAGADCDGQVLVWHDLLGLTTGRLPRFVKQYANLRAEITQAVKTFDHEVVDGVYPGPEHTYEA